MKALSTFGLIFLLGLFVTACGGNKSENSVQSPAQDRQPSDVKTGEQQNLNPVKKLEDYAEKILEGQAAIQLSEEDLREYKMNFSFTKADGFILKIMEKDSSSFDRYDGGIDVVNSQVLSLGEIGSAKLQASRDCFIINIEIPSTKEYSELGDFAVCEVTQVEESEQEESEK